MSIKVSISNRFQKNEIKINSDGIDKNINVPAKSIGYGSSLSGGELLFLALATCVCNDMYREAGKRSIKLTSVDVIVNGSFLKEGQAGTDITYSVKATSDESSDEEISRLIDDVDKIAEIHNTVRQGTPVKLITQG